MNCFLIAEVPEQCHDLDHHETIETALLTDLCCDSGGLWRLHVGQRHHGRAAMEQTIGLGDKVAMLPVANFTDVPQAGLRVEALLEPTLRQAGLRQLAVYPPELNPETLFEPGERKAQAEAEKWARGQGMRYVVSAAVNEWRYKVGVDGEPDVGLMVQVGAPPALATAGDTEMFAINRELHDYFREPKRLAERGAAVLEQLSGELEGRMNRSQFLYTEESWNYTTGQYKEYCTAPSFVDYFWTVRTMHTPIWVLSAIVENFPPVRCYHTVSTGYAGFLGALLKRRHGKSLILSEHGIYTKERRIDLYAVRWIADNRTVLQRDPTQAGYFRALWIRFFEALGRMCYDASDQIIALYEANRLRQVLDGAQASRTSNIANGIDVVRLARCGPCGLKPSRPSCA